MVSLSFTCVACSPLSQRTSEKDKKQEMPQETDAQQGTKELVREALAHYALGRYDAMLVACEQALKVDKTAVRAHHVKALALIELGRCEEAVSSLNRALRFAGSAPPYYH